MSAVIETFLMCDGRECYNTFGVDQRSDKASRQRVNAKLNGWVTKFSKDYCPECAAKIKELTKKTV